jgi:hypothetical protein
VAKTHAEITKDCLIWEDVYLVVLTKLYRQMEDRVFTRHLPHLLVPDLTNTLIQTEFVRPVQ